MVETMTFRGRNIDPLLLGFAALVALAILVSDWAWSWMTGNASDTDSHSWRVFNATEIPVVVTFDFSTPTQIIAPGKTVNVQPKIPAQPSDEQHLMLHSYVAPVVLYDGKFIPDAEVIVSCAWLTIAELAERGFVLDVVAGTDGSPECETRWSEAASLGKTYRTEEG
jgi:hypothetical protein